jgi:enamine deaminase RidA (YjgF/YER057c/UK114 family)
MQTSLRFLTLGLTIVLLGISGHIHADDTQFQLTLPLQGTAEESLQQLERILTAIGAKFRADASPAALMTATLEDGKHITITHARDRDTNALSFVVQCVGVEGGAEALCQNIARRYRKQ